MFLYFQIPLIMLQISAFFAGNLEFFCLPVGFRTRGASLQCSSARSHPVVHEFHQRAADYISLVNKVIQDGLYE